MSLRVCNTCHKHLVNTTVHTAFHQQETHFIRKSIGALLDSRLPVAVRRTDTAEPSSDNLEAALYGEAEPPPEED